MVKPEQIPDEVVEAAAKLLCARHNGDDYWDSEMEYQKEAIRERWRDDARAAIAAALAAWPGWEGSWTEDGGDLRRTLILPLPQEGGEG